MGEEKAKSRVPNLRERVPDIRGRIPELSDELRTRGTELRTKGTELRSKGTELARQYAEMDVPWARCNLAKAAREGLISLGLGPLIDFYVRNRTVGREVFDNLDHPVVFVANHSSHLDTPTILRAMPRKWRARTAVAAAADYFYRNRLKAAFVALIFCTVPIQRRAGGKATMEHLDRLLDQRWNLLLYPEGTRSRDGTIGRLRSGAAFLAAQHGLRIVPIAVRGTREAMPPGHSWPHRLRGRFFTHRHKVEIEFGEPIDPATCKDRDAVMERVRAFLERDSGPPQLPAGPEVKRLSPAA
jgi:1-acyl-sn-glycerol-3-phosphate acyltransferase